MATESKTAAEFAAAEIAAQSAEKPTPTPLTEDIPALKAEIQRLQAELTAKETKTRETLEFSLLYPGIPLDGLPQEVKEAEELPLAAAYALYERKKLLLADRRKQSTRRMLRKQAVRSVMTAARTVRLHWKKCAG